MGRAWCGCALVALVLAGCAPTHGGAGESAVLLPAGPPAAVAVDEIPLAEPTDCGPSFVEHVLPVATEVDGPIRMFDSNGSGVATDDLDGDGDLDLVFANLDGPNSILWNEGALRFTRGELADRGSRAANVVDVDGDGRLDVVFSHRAGGVSLWRNAGTAAQPRRFERAYLRGVHAPAYSIAWGDIDGDGRLDLVTGSYDAELHLELGDTFLFGPGAGVYVYLQRPGGFEAERLARAAHALAIALPDLDLDGRRDLLVGNDFNVPDRAWRWTGAGWSEVRPFATTTEDTMSLAEADIDNDGRLELFATDMKPYAIDTHTLASWLPVMAKMPQRKDRSDPQIIANVLQVRDAADVYRDEATPRGVSASGWAWSGKFGDLDADGFLDLYVVNGMIDGQTLGHLPGHELVEENQAYRNQGDGTFAPARRWGLGARESGRGLAIGDLDDDGDLDVVVNNLAANARLFENRLCGGAHLQVDLRWPGSSNSHALGARLALVTEAGTYRRDVVAGSGYLSGDPSRQHFGVPAGATPVRLEVVWPDGARSTVERPALSTRLVVTRTEEGR